MIFIYVAYLVTSFEIAYLSTCKTSILTKMCKSYSKLFIAFTTVSRKVLIAKIFV